jgi:hypothetical protein
MPIQPPRFLLNECGRRLHPYYWKACARITVTRCGVPGMQAYESTPCPHCGATWNRPDAQFCQDCQRPLVLKQSAKAPRRHLLFAIGGLMLAVGVAELGIAPVLASNALAADQQALTTTFSRQPVVDAAMAAFLTPLDQKTGHGGIAETDLHLAQYQSALDAVRGDKKRIQDADQQLGWMATFAVSKQSEVNLMRKENQAALEALRQADGALTTAVDQASVIQSISAIQPLFDQMLNAAQAKDYAAAEKIYPDIDRKLVVAESLVVYPDFPNGARSLVRFLRSFLDDTEKVIVAARTNDQIAGRAATVALQADAKEARQYNAGFFAQWDQWNVTSLKPVMAAYHDGLRQAKSGS